MATPEELAAAADEALIQALQRGQSVSFGDRSWTSHDLAKLLSIRASLNSGAGTAGTGVNRFASFSKGVT